jgi:hypothetical protein
MFRIACLAALFTVTRVSAGTEDLWSLYVYEHAANLCGLQLTDDQEDDLDAAQQRTRIQMGLSRPEAAELYRRARETVRSSQQGVCSEHLQTGSIHRKTE